MKFETVPFKKVGIGIELLLIIIMKNVQDHKMYSFSKYVCFKDQLSNSSYNEIYPHFSKAYIML